MSTPVVAAVRTVPLLMLPPLAAGIVVANDPVLALLLTGAIGLAAVVWWRPVTAAYLIIGVTPLVAGIDRDTVMPLLRPHEALATFLIGVLGLRWLTHTYRGRARPVRWHPVERSLVLLAFASSVLPLTWLVVRGLPMTADDVSYALVLWKYAAVYALVRVTVTTKEQIYRCLVISVVAAVSVGVIAIVQVLGVGVVRSILAQFYVTHDHVGAVELPRASSTLALPAATADLLLFNAGIAVGLWFFLRRHRVFYLVAVAVFVVGTFAAAEFSSALGLLVAAMCLSVALRSRALIGWLIPVGGAGIALMWPLVSHRLDGFSTAYGLPISWLGRLHNLETYFWPQLGEGVNLLFGVRPSARVPVSSQVTGYVWIESGYTWLLWAGGLPLLAAFIYFVFTVVRLARTQMSLAPTSDPPPSVARVTGAATLSAIAVIVTLMIFDPHLTYRGSADCFFALLALTVVGARAGAEPVHTTERRASCALEESDV